MEISNKHIYMAYKAGAVEVIRHRSQLNKINVFPVADGDTGSNLASLMKGILHGSTLGDTVDVTMSSIAEAALVGARGNSGIIFAQYLTGLSMSMTRGTASISMNDFAIANTLAVKKAYEAVEEPVEGTMLTLIKVFSDGISRYFNHDEVAEIATLNNVIGEMGEALNKTTDQLEVLKKAEVVDAGAKGFYHFVAGFISFLLSPKEEMVETDVVEEVFFDEPILHDEHITYRYCTEALVRHCDMDIATLKKEILDFGDSVIVAGSELLFRLHIHTNEPTKVFSVLRQHGLITFQKVDDMKAQNILVKGPKYKIGLITDSVADIPMSMVDAYEIQVMPLDLLYKEEVFIDRLTITNSEVLHYDGLGKDRPTSSQPKLAKVQELYERMKKAYDHVLVLPVAKALSGTYNVFVQAREGICDDGFTVEVIDTKQNSAAQGLLVATAAKLIDEGYAFKQLIKAIEEKVSKSKIYVAVKNLDAMIRSGRLSTKGGKIAKTINLKPIVTLDEQGDGGLGGIAFSFKGSLKKISGKLEKIQKISGLEGYCVVHINNAKMADVYAETLIELLGMQPMYIEEVSSVIAVGAGEGAVAVGYIHK